MTASIAKHQFSESIDYVSGSLDVNGGMLAGPDMSLAQSGTTTEKPLWFDKDAVLKGDPFMVKSKMPDWMSVHPLEGYEIEHWKRSIPAYLAGSNYGYSHEVYEAAGDIYERLAVRKPEGEYLVSYPPVDNNAAPPQFTNQRMKRQAYELAYETLKYQELLEEILIESGYFFAHPSSEDTSALVMVMLFDLQNRKWVPRSRVIGEIFSEDVAEVEENLLDHRIRLAAALARSRVKNQSLTIDYILPEEVRQQEKSASLLPQYGWVNTIKSSAEAVVKSLEENDYIEFKDSNNLIPTKGKYYRRDQHCEDVLAFPGGEKEALKCLKIVENGSFVLQDKTSSLAARSVGALLTEDDECDLIHADVASGYTTAHLATLLYNVTKKRLAAKRLMYGQTISYSAFRQTSMSSSGYGFTELSSNDEDQPQGPTVYAFGVRDDNHMQQLTQLYKKLGIRNIQLSKEKFENLNPKQEDRFDRVKAILVTPQCTRTAVANPIEFMLNEGDKETYDVLRDLSHGERHKKSVEASLAHTETLKAALKFSSVQAVVYATRSIHGHENEHVVNTSIKWHRDNVEGVRPFKVCPPILTLLTRDMRESDRRANYATSNFSSKRSNSISGSLKQNFLRMRQTSQMNGCFVAVLSRELDLSDSMTVKDVLRRAALQGLIVPSVSAAPPKTKVALVPEEAPIEKEKHQKPKVAFGKKLKEKSGHHGSHQGHHRSHQGHHGSHHKPHHPSHHKSPAKSVGATDVHKLADSYEKNHGAKNQPETQLEIEDKKAVLSSYTFGGMDLDKGSTVKQKIYDLPKPTTTLSTSNREDNK